MTSTLTASRHGSRHRVRTLLAAVLAISLIASACGDDDDAVLSTDEHGATSVDDEHLTTELAALPVTTISDAEQTHTDPAIALVYANLEKGSRNHLRAFIGQLDSRGETYTPSFITQADFDAIVSSPTERGNAS